MKTTGIVRRIDDLGRIVIPKELREVMDLNPRDGMEVFVEKDSIILRKYASGCFFCGKITDNEYKGMRVCEDCITWR